MTLNLASDTEARMRSVAEMRGQGPEEALIALLNQVLAEAEADLAQIVMTEEESQKVLAALRRSEEDYAAGRWISLEDYEAQIQKRRQECNVRPAAPAIVDAELLGRYSNAG